MSDETIERTFQVGSPAHLIISNVRGSITISPGESGEIVVRAIRHGNSDSGKNVVEISQDADGAVRVETRKDEALFGLLSHLPKVDYSVRVPQGIHLEASCVSSKLNVSGLEGEFRLKTISGNMDLAKLSGPLKLNAVSGDISGSQLAGRLDLSTVSGKVHMEQSSFPAADATTVSGDLLLQTPVSEGPYQFSAVSGSVRMIVPADTRCNIELNSVSGSIRSSLPTTFTHIGHGSKNAQVQNGGTSIRLKSVSGGVSLETEGVSPETVPVTSETNTASEKPAPASPAAPPNPPASPEAPVPPASPAPLSTAEILQRIERAEMTVDEAIKLMKNQP